MSLYRLLLRTLRCSSSSQATLHSHNQVAISHPLRFSQDRFFAFSSAEEAAAERRRRKRRLRIEPPLNAIRPPPRQSPSRDPNAPRLPDSTSALVGRRLSLHNRVQSLIRAGDLDAASAVARHSVFSNTRPCVFTCNAIIAAMYRAKRYNEAIALFQYFFNQFEIVPNIVSYNNLINTHCDEGRIDVGLEVYHNIIANAPFSPSTVTYRHLTKGLIDAGRIGEAVDLLREMLNKGHGADSLVYNNLISGFLKLENLEKANELFNELKERCMVYDGVVTATYMEWFFNKARDKEAMESYKSLMDRQFKMTPATCNVLLEVLLKHGKKTEAWALFDQMLDNHTPPNFQAVNSDTFNIMVNECFKLGKFSEALATFKKSGTKPNSKPFAMDVAGYNNIIARFCENGMLAEAETLFEELCSKSLSPDVPTHRTLIDAYLKMERINDALRVLERMVDAGLRVVASFGNRVFNELINNVKAIDCAQILSKMGEKDPKPDPTCYEVVIKGLCGQGLLDKSRELLDEVRRHGVGITPTLREFVIEAFQKAGRGEEIEKLLEMNRIGYSSSPSAPRPPYCPPAARSPARMEGASNPPFGPPSQTTGQQCPPLPSAQMAGVYNSPSGPSSQMAGQQHPPLPSSQMAGVHNPPSGPPHHLAGQQHAPLSSAQMVGVHNSPSGAPPQVSGQQRQPLPSQMPGMHQPSRGVPSQVNVAHMPVSGSSSHNAGPHHYPPPGIPSHMTGAYQPTLGVAPPMTAQHYMPSIPSPQMTGYQPYETPQGPPQMAGQRCPPSGLTPPMAGHYPPSGPTPPIEGSSLPSYGAPGYQPLSGPPHFAESHQQQSEAPEQVAAHS